MKQTADHQLPTPRFQTPTSAFRMIVLLLPWAACSCAGAHVSRVAALDPGNEPIELPADAQGDVFASAFEELRDLRERLNIRAELRQRSALHEEKPQAETTVLPKSAGSSTTPVARTAKGNVPTTNVATRHTARSNTGFESIPCAPDDPNRWDPLNGCLP